MKERFIVRHCPETGVNLTQRFGVKGLTFAYASRRAPMNCDNDLQVERQVVDPAGSITDEKTGLNVRPADVWTFHKDGSVDHARL